MWAENIIHRDLKLANVLLHFPEYPELNDMRKKNKLEFLKKFDFSTGKF